MNIPTPPQNADNPAIYAESTHPKRYSIQTNEQYRTELILACRKCFETASDQSHFSACMKGIQALTAEISVTSKTDEIFLQGAELAFLSIMEEKQ
jgi:hypothetical protein